VVRPGEVAAEPPRRSATERDLEQIGPAGAEPRLAVGQVKIPHSAKPIRIA